MSIITIFILMGIGILIGYLLFGRKRYYEIKAPKYAEISRGSNFLETAGAVAAGVLAAEAIEHIAEDMMDDEIIEESMEEFVDDIGDDMGDFVDDIGDLEF
ncbi:hypothetical protein [Methanotorris igneus]|uniref:Uncharacterized protein n=1 Tax=Methanotorris igneus (strain DSM 5666 / JCM 11834 / Kol 5) TaxID=880724 RepID=F6BDA0_METIK|nr:hypothetical protein [Methanotorris igneus]AEF96461.1 hypothetical protein Metig_0918 [Methanotorris igneus Kol 5]